MSEIEPEPRVLTAVGGRRVDAPANAGDPDGGGFDASLVSLVLRGDKLPLRNAVSSCYNAAAQQLVVVTAPALYLYGNLLELGGEMLGVVAADENVQFQHALVLPWLDVYSAFAANLNGHIEHRVVSADFSECHLAHVIAERGALFTAFANPFRREVITADSDGGFKVWAIRATVVANNTKTLWKGFQRIHAGSRKTSYNHLYLAGDDQTILACTKTRVHAFDSTTCARIGTFYKDSSHTIVGASFDRDRDTIYLQINESRRHVYKLQGSSFRGRIHSLETCGLCGEEEDIAAFEAIVRGGPCELKLLEAQSDGIFVLDTMGKLAVATCSRYETSSTPERRSISLPLAPSAEAYVAIHVQTLRHESRNFVIVVCSSGLVVVEAVLPETSMPARRVLTNIAGTKATMLDVNEKRRIAIFNSLPPSLLLFDENRTDTFFAILLQFPSNQESQAGAVGHRRDPCMNSVVDFAGLRRGVVVVWSSGYVTRYCLQTERTITVGEVDATPVVVQSSASWGGSQEEWVFVGDDQGAVSIWELYSDNTVRFVCTKSLHSQRLLSIYPTKGDSVKHSACVVTVANDGEVKLSSLRGLDKNTVAWELLVCFRTYATSLSATGFMGPEFLFCGSEEGGFECWRLPIIPSTHSLEDRSGRHVAVLKRPLHSIDLHLTRVCQVIVEPGDAAQRVSNAQPHLDEFAWVITYDLDHVVLIWCFSTSFLLPHRKLRPHAIPVGGFLTAVDECSFRFYAYLGRCLDSLDVTSGLDKRAIKRRLANARDTDKPASIHNPKHIQIYGKELRNQARQRDKELDNSPAASVRLRVTLPTVTQADALVDLDASRRTSPQKVPRTKPNREPTESRPDITKSSISYSEEFVHNEDRLWSEGRSLSPSLGKVTSNSISREETSDAEPRQSLQRPVSSFVPDTVPSQFQKAKPRVYRSNNRPMVPVNHPQLSVVTSTINSHGSHSATLKRTTIEKRKQTNQWDDKTQHPQDRVAVVSITDDDVAGHLRLDFQSAEYTKRISIRGDDEYHERSDGDRRAPAHYLSWSSLGGESQLVELKAATRSRFVVQEASEARVTLPMYEDFSSDDVKAQLRVRAFSRWYLSAQHARQRIREAFLLEELRFAAQDAFVNMTVKSSGCTVPSKFQIGDDASLLRTPFALWYATGNPFFGESTPPTIEDSPKRTANRLQERTTFLNKRLEALGTTELDQGQPSSLSVFIFDIPQLSDGGAGSGIDFASWDIQTSECRQCELLLALNDPMIQVAAIAEGVELPDVTVMKLENIDVLALATAFVDWWGSTGNIFRQDFLNQEIAEALGDESVREMLNNNRQGGEMESNIERETYFRSSMMREQFLLQKLQRRRYQRRIAEIFHSGKQAAPILFESLQTPAFVPFRFPVAKVTVSEAHEDCASSEVLELEEATEEEETVGEQTTPRDNDETNDEWRREGEELALMAVEDALSRELDHGYDSASEDEQETVERESLEPPKRTDFTKSYFFGNLPKTFRINAGGWLAGSGIDNGDEEAEEEERLERERQHQEMLDRLEAERLAEAERQAERMRIEKQMDEKALQMRRIRQLELKKILVYQAEVEARRFEHDEHQNMLREQAAMEAEDLAMKAWLTFLKEQRAAMEHEDRLAAQIALAERHARRDDMRRILAEMTQMDAEDRRSAVAQAEYLALERKQQLRVQYLTELYEPFEPFFSESKTSSDEMLPVITQRTKQVPKSRKPGYALPLSEVLALGDDVEQELYAARDSRRLRQLMGLPVTTPHSKRMMRIPSEHEIIKTRHDLQLMLPPTDDCAERDRVDLNVSGGGIIRSPYANKASNSNHAGRGEHRVRLPELVHWKAQRDDQRLTDLTAPPSPASANQHKHSDKSKTKPADQLERQKPSLPFFRGNFIVEGTKSRSHAYAQK